MICHPNFTTYWFVWVSSSKFILVLSIYIMDCQRTTRLKRQSINCWELLFVKIFLILVRKQKRIVLENSMYRATCLVLALLLYPVEVNPHSSVRLTGEKTFLGTRIFSCIPVYRHKSHKRLDSGQINLSPRTG